MAVYATRPPHSRSSPAVMGPITGSIGSQSAMPRATDAAARASGAGGMAQRASVARVAATTAAPIVTRSARGHDTAAARRIIVVKASTATAALVIRAGNGGTHTRGSATLSAANMATNRNAWRAQARGCTRDVNQGSNVAIRASATSRAKNIALRAPRVVLA